MLATKLGKIPENEKTNEDLPQRETWSSKRDFLLTTIGLVVGLGTVWRFPYLCAQNGGGAFLIPYILMVILLGIPMFVMELSIGQLLSAGGLGAYNVAPIFKGIGYAAAVISCWVNVYYIVVLVWALFYFIMSFSAKLPWSECKNEWNSEYCVDRNYLIGESCSEHLVNGESHLLCQVGSRDDIPVEKLTNPETEFWKNRVLELSSGVEDLGGIRCELAALLFGVWMICYFSIWKGVKWTGKVAHVTVLLPYCILIAFLVRGISLPGADMGINFFLYPDYSKLANPDVWMDAVIQVLFSFGLGLGTLIALGSYNKRENYIHRDALLVCGVHLLTSIIAGLVIFSYVGFLAYQKDLPIAMMLTSGPNLAFLTMPAALLELPYAGLWTALFFLMLILLGIDSQFATVEGVITAITDEWPHLFRQRRKAFAAVVCFLTFLAGLTCITEGGMHVLGLLDTYAVNPTVLIAVLLLECVAFSWAFGANQLCAGIRDMVGFNPLSLYLWKCCWLIITPFILLIGCTYQMMQSLSPAVNDYPVPAQIFGWFAGLSSVLCIPSYAIWICWKKPDSISLSTDAKLKTLLQPEFVSAAPRQAEFCKV